MSLPIDLSEALAARAGRLGPFASRILWYPEIGSTNDAAAALADRGAEEGTLVIADAQTAGRGRLGRTWASPAGAGIYATAVLRPERHVAPRVTLAAGVAIAEGIEAATGLRASVKWPNDIFISGNGASPDRKLAGILAEGGGDPSPWVVLGFGINVLPAAYPPDVSARATSLESELGRAVDCHAVLAECLAALWTRYTELREHRASRVMAAWRDRAAATFGRRVEWDAAGTVRRGVVQHLDDDGALVIGTDAGTARVISGEVRWI